MPCPLYLCVVLNDAGLKQYVTAILIQNGVNMPPVMTANVITSVLVLLPKHDRLIAYVGHNCCAAILLSPSNGNIVFQMCLLKRHEASCMLGRDAVKRPSKGMQHYSAKINVGACVRGNMRKRFFLNILS